MIEPNYKELGKTYQYPIELLFEIKLFYKQNFSFITKNGDKNHEKQQIALTYLCDNKTKELGYGGAAGGAKSWTGCTWEMMMALSYPDTKYFIAREELKSLRRSSLKTIHKVSKAYHIEFEKLWKINNNDNVINFKNGSSIDLLAIAMQPSDEDYAWLGSLEFTSGWVEESGEAKSIMAYEILKTRIGRQNNDKYQITAKIFNTFNPKKNYVYSYFHQREKNGTLPENIKFIRCLADENPHQESQYLAQLDAITIASQKARLRYGDFEYDDDPRSLCQYEAICDMFVNEHVEPGDAYGSADLAMQGRDNFVAGNWQGMIGYIRVVKPKATGIEIEQDIRKLMIDYRIPHSRFVVDSTGMGSYLESYITGIKEFNFANAAESSLYTKLKDECGYKLAELINKREIYIICSSEIAEKIKEELAQLKADDVDADTKKMKLIPKDEMKGYLGRSPDFLDWLILRMYFEVKQFSSGYVGR